MCGAAQNFHIPSFLKYFVTPLVFLVHTAWPIVGHAENQPRRDLKPNWSFSPGAEFPGAGGRIESRVSQGKKLAVLHYQLGCEAKRAILPGGTKSCGRYVAMSYRPDPPIEVAPGDAPTLVLDLLNPQGVLHPSLRVKDATGQTLQFRIPSRTLENVDGKSWQRVQQFVGRGGQYFGGAADGILHPPIKEISVVAGDTGLLFPPGELQVANIHYLSTDSATTDLATLQFQQRNPMADTYVGHLAVTAHAPSGVALDKAKAAGIRIIRTDLFWPAVERNGGFNFERYDRLAEELRKRGMSALWILDYGHPDHGGGPPLTPEQRQAYAEFATQVAKRYRGAVTYAIEIWNEPHLDKYWKNPDPLAYGQLLYDAAKAIKKVAPEVKVVSSGVGTPDVPFIVKMLSVSKTWPIDAIGLHPYRKGNPENHAAYVEPMRQAIEAEGSSLPVWDTEWGYSSAVDLDRAEYGDGRDPRALNRQGQLQLRKVLTQMALGSELQTLYALNDEGNNPNDREHNFGLLTKDDQDKPAIEALRALYAAQSGRTFQGMATNAPPGLHVARWAGKGDVVYGIWADAGPRQFAVKLPSGKLLYGDSGKRAGIQSGELTLLERDGVTFILMGRGAGG